MTSQSSEKQNLQYFQSDRLTGPHCALYQFIHVNSYLLTCAVLRLAQLDTSAKITSAKSGEKLNTQKKLHSRLPIAQCTMITSYLVDSDSQSCNNEGDYQQHSGREDRAGIAEGQSAGW